MWVVADVRPVGLGRSTGRLQCRSKEKVEGKRGKVGVCGEKMKDRLQKVGESKSLE